MLFRSLDVLEVKKKEEVKSEQKDDWSGFIKLCGVVFSRSILSNGISTFLAFYFIQQFSKSNSFASMILSVFYGIGSIAILLGGGIADCFGHRKMVRLSFCIFLPAIFIFTNTSHFVIALIMLIFMTCGEKGEKAQGKNKITGYGIAMPATVICGVKDGPTILITAGIHSAEYVEIGRASCRERV